MVSNGVQKKLCRQLSRTPTYLAIANKLFSEEERADIVALVAADPECGDLIRGTGGFRRDGEKWRGAGCLYLAQRKVSGFSNHGFSEERERKLVDGRAQRAKETGGYYFRDLWGVA
jgi:hypothetical protein